MRIQGFDFVEKNAALAEEVRRTFADIDRIESELKKAAKAIGSASGLVSKYRGRLQALCDTAASAKIAPKRNATAATVKRPAHKHSEETHGCDHTACERRSFPHSASAVPVQPSQAAVFLAIFPLVILGLCFHAALIRWTDHGRRPVVPDEGAVLRACAVRRRVDHWNALQGQPSRRVGEGFLVLICHSSSWLACYASVSSPSMTAIMPPRSG